MTCRHSAGLLQATMGLVEIIILASVAIGFKQSTCPNNFGINRNKQLFSSSSLSSGFDENSDHSDKNSSFDFDFANAISKPLPEWFQKQREERERYVREVEENRERILREFREKYEISEQRKAAEREERWQRFKAKLEKNKQRSRIFGGIFSSTTPLEEKEETTREKWEKIWAEKADEEEKEFMLPGFFDVFPELRIQWPKWSKNRNGGLTRCESDRDCPVPQACCPHPIIPGEKFCCTGFGRRILEPAYAPQEALAPRIPDREEGTDAAKRKGAKKPWEWED